MERGENYADRIAPPHLFLPTIMTHYTPEERKKLWQKISRRIENNRWVGNQKGRPTAGFATQHCRQRAIAGKRKRTTKIVKGVAYTQEPQALVLVSHAVLVANGRYPQEDEQASHLCHNGKCVHPDHLVWEPVAANMRRVRCAREGECVCGNEIKCLMQCLP